MKTIKVQRDGKRGFRVINEADFDPKVHKAYEDKPSKPAKAAKTASEDK